MRVRELRLAPTDAERALWNALRNRQLAGHKFRRQHPIGPFFADFACVEADLVVELDGSHHLQPDVLERDRERTLALNRHGFQVLRFDDRQALTEQAGVLSTVLNWLKARHPHPNPLPRAGEGADQTQGASS